jgi:hypothetical protein
MLLLVGVSLFLTSCKTAETSYFNQEATGNAWATTLPVGTHIVSPNTKVLLPAFEEIKDGVLVKPCVLVSKEYLDKRDQELIEAYFYIKELKMRKDATP